MLGKSLSHNSYKQYNQTALFNSYTDLQMAHRMIYYNLYSEKKTNDLFFCWYYLFNGVKRYTIRSWKHKGLKDFWETGSKAGIQASHAPKLSRMLHALNLAEEITDMDFPGYHLHPLKGEKDGLWSVRVNGNWRVTFAFECGDAYVLNYEDYH